MGVWAGVDGGAHSYQGVVEVAFIVAMLDNAVGWSWLTVFSMAGEGREVARAGLPEIVAESIPAGLARTLGPGVPESET